MGGAGLGGLVGYHVVRLCHVFCETSLLVNISSGSSEKHVWRKGGARHMVVEGGGGGLVGESGMSAAVCTITAIGEGVCLGPTVGIRHNSSQHSVSLAQVGSMQKGGGGGA